MPNTADRIKFLSLAAAALLLSGVPAAAADFPSIVQAILDSQTDGPLAEMDADKRGRMTDCVIDTLGALPSGKQRYIVEGANFDEQEDRFGEVVDENHAKWRQTIAKACGHIAVDDT